MFKAYAGSESKDEKPKINDDTKEIIWLENQSFTSDLPTNRPVTQTPPKKNDTKVNQVKIPIKKQEKETPIPPPVSQKETNQCFYIDRQRDRANLTISYSTGVPRYGSHFCCQNALGSANRKKKRKEIIKRYFQVEISDEEKSIDEFLSLDPRLEELNAKVRQEPHSFEAWKDLIDYQPLIFKELGDKFRDEHLYRKQLSIADRALEQNNNRLQYRLLQQNIRTDSHLFDQETLEKEWDILINDSFRSSDDRTIHECWFSYLEFLLGRVELFSIEKVESVLTRFFSSFNYQIETRSEKERRFITSYMIEVFNLWTRVLRDSGYPERAISLYQAMIDLNFDPSSVKFTEKIEKFAKFWDSDKIRFGENEKSEKFVEVLEENLKICSTKENESLTPNFTCWICLEEMREKFYEENVLNSGFHINSGLLEKLSDSSQIDPEIASMSFDRSIRPFLFQCSDDKSLFQLIVNFLDLTNGLPRLKIVEEIFQQWKMQIFRKTWQLRFVEEQFREISPFIDVGPSLRSEKQFSFEFNSRIYEKLIDAPKLKNFQVDLILLYFHYAAKNLVELRETSSTKYKVRWKIFQSSIKKYLSIEQFRSNLRIYSHYGRIEFEYFRRQTEARRIFDLCFQTIRSNPNKFDASENFSDLCFYVSTFLRCEFGLNELFDRIFSNLFDRTPWKFTFDQNKILSIVETIFKKIFGQKQMNESISLLIDALKSIKTSKWDQEQTGGQLEDFLRRNPNFALKTLAIFLFYSILLGDPFEKLHQIVRSTILPIVNENRNKFQTSIVEEIIEIYLAMLWNELANEKLRFDRSNEFLEEILQTIRFHSIVLSKFTAVYVSFLPLYSKSTKFFQKTLVDFRFNEKIDSRFNNQILLLMMNLIRHIFIRRAASFPQQSNSGYEHRVRHIFRQITRDYSNNVELWLFFEQFERFSAGNQLRVNAVLYEAMQNCPSVKEFYMKLIKSVEKELEWKLFLNAMFKSGVHLLLPLEEFEMLQELIEMKDE